MDTGSSETRVRTAPSSHPIDAGGFAPGTILADRYRIVALAGRGGMGEVYRADDLKLGQTVALKLRGSCAREAVRVPGRRGGRVAGIQRSRELARGRSGESDDPRSRDP